MNWFLRIGAGVLLALGLAVTAFAATPDGKTAATAIPLSTSTGASGSLTGSGAGAFVNYTFDYPGDGSVGTVTISASPADQAVENAVGVNVYQAGSRLATMNAISPTPGTNSVTFSSSTRGPALVQVYNYDPGVTVSYHLSLSGVHDVAPMQAPTAVATATPAPAGSPNNPAPLMKSASGMLAGNPAGSFVAYTIDYPGDGSIHTITLNYSPGGVDVGNAIVLSAYQNGATLASINGSHATAPGQLVLSFSSTTKGPVLIQLGNYNPSPTISYTIGL